MLDAMLRGLIIRSRTRRTHYYCLIARPYCPALFQQDAPLGPQLLLQRQERIIEREHDFMDLWHADVVRKKIGGRQSKGKWPLPCRICSDEKETDKVTKPIRCMRFPSHIQVWLALGKR